MELRKYHNGPRKEFASDDLLSEYLGRTHLSVPVALPSFIPLAVVMADIASDL
jgi:hypothetical protein